MDRMINHK